MAIKLKQDSAKVSRIRITIPNDDKVALEWLSCQYSPSISIRMLIREAIERDGMRDFFATDEGEVVKLPRRGRPPKAYVEKMESEDIDDADETFEENAEIKEAPKVEQKQVLSDSQLSARERILKMQDLLNK